MEKIRNWWNKKGKAQLEKAIRRIQNWWKEKGKSQVVEAISLTKNGLTWCLNQIAKVRINWMFILVAVALAYMGEQGMLDKWPAIEWLAQCELRLVDWIFSLLKGLLQWAFGSETFLPNEFTEWVKYIFALS